MALRPAETRSMNYCTVGGAAPCGSGFETKSGNGRGGSITVVKVLNCGGGIDGTPLYGAPLICKGTKSHLI
ncbi:hypothetical protein ANCCAN_13897 [Ancylostoma caninum]|uniref:Uncharacterized protein n=1 Tax=Ancylostoma caninum TaxID=29170 RepID=A0A368G6V5_ANCCA|nr:hypothetical protein ANCCAN_13897 [Ancylostoma caninum]